MLVVRELEREVKDLNKFEKDALHVHQKNIATRQTREGAIKDVANIPEKKWDYKITKNQLNRMQEIIPDVVIVPNQRKDDKNKQNQLAIQDNNDESAAGNKQKLNIFDAQDSTMLKHEQLARIGHDNTTIPRDDSHSQISRQSSQYSGKLQPISHAPKPRQQKESARDFILNSRKILMAQLSIQDKTKETDLLKEYIIMEKEKLSDGKKAFTEDRDKYNKFKDDL